MAGLIKNVFKDVVGGAVKSVKRNVKETVSEKVSGLHKGLASVTPTAYKNSKLEKMLGTFMSERDTKRVNYDLRKKEIENAKRDGTYKQNRDKFKDKEEKIHRKEDKDAHKVDAKESKKSTKTLGGGLDRVEKQLKISNKLFTSIGKHLGVKDVGRIGAEGGRYSGRFGIAGGLLNRNSAKQTNGGSGGGGSSFGLVGDLAGAALTGGTLMGGWSLSGFLKNKLKKMVGLGDKAVTPTPINAAAEGISTGSKGLSNAAEVFNPEVLPAATKAAEGAAEGTATASKFAQMSKFASKGPVKLLGRAALPLAGLMSGFSEYNSEENRGETDKVKARRSLAVGAGTMGGVAAGAAIGGTAGAALAPFTAGLSIPIGMAIGGYLGGEGAEKISKYFAHAMFKSPEAKREIDRDAKQATDIKDTKDIMNERLPEKSFWGKVKDFVAPDNSNRPKVDYTSTINAPQPVLDSSGRVVSGGDVGSSDASDEGIADSARQAAQPRPLQEKKGFFRRMFPGMDGVVNYLTGGKKDASNVGYDNSHKTGVDCSSLVHGIYEKSGIKVNARTAAGMQHELGSKGLITDMSQLVPGDMVFFRDDTEADNRKNKVGTAANRSSVGAGDATHVATYVGNGEVVEIGGKAGIDNKKLKGMKARPYGHDSSGKQTGSFLGGARGKGGIKDSAKVMATLKADPTTSSAVASNSVPSTVDTSASSNEAIAPTNTKSVEPVKLVDSQAASTHKSTVQTPVDKQLKELTDTTVNNIIKKEEIAENIDTQQQSTAVEQNAAMEKHSSTLQGKILNELSSNVFGSSTDNTAQLAVPDNRATINRLRSGYNKVLPKTSLLPTGINTDKASAQSLSPTNELSSMDAVQTPISGSQQSSTAATPDKTGFFDSVGSFFKNTGANAVAAYNDTIDTVKDAWTGNRAEKSRPVSASGATGLKTANRVAESGAIEPMPRHILQPVTANQYPNSALAQDEKSTATVKSSANSQQPSMARTQMSNVVQPRLDTDGIFHFTDAGINLVIMGVV